LRAIKSRRKNSNNLNLKRNAKVLELKDLKKIKMKIMDLIFKVKDKIKYLMYHSKNNSRRRHQNKMIKILNSKRPTNKFKNFVPNARDQNVLYFAKEFVADLFIVNALNSIINNYKLNPTQMNCKNSE
jgi:hypothetical protein